MTDLSAKINLPRKSAFSCEGCRKRKVKCNGASPSCARCAARGDICIYSLAPTLSYTKTLERKVAQLEETLARLQAGGLQDNGRPTASPQGFSSDIHSSPGLSHEQEEREDDRLDLCRDFEGLKVEDDGRISFHGPTSLFQLPTGITDETSTFSYTKVELEARKERLISSAQRERAFEQFSVFPVRHITEPFQYLLDFHWCWIQPLFNFVYRPAFTRDMNIRGPYYSDILLNAILSHSVRWCQSESNVGALLESYDGGAKFHEDATSGLYETLRFGFAKIPTVQTLLLLSAQECGRGNRTQAWVYSGMAFRLVEDLGITIDSRKYSKSVQFSDEDIEIRNRLFWSCYFWDKIIALYFGRSPAIQNSRVSPPRIIHDTSESELWTPQGVVFPDGRHYPPTQAHSTSCFMKVCVLAEILNQIIIHLYDPLRQSTEYEFYSCVREQEGNLKEWWESLPDFLRLEVSNLPVYCPPSHIVTLNCLYHTVNILLHRPILSCRPPASKQEEPGTLNHLIQCMSSATAILMLFDLYRRTFGDSHVVLFLAYSLYTAASIFLLEIQALKFADPITINKLRFCIVSLERVKIVNPVMSTGLNLIYQELQKLQQNIPIPVPEPPGTLLPQSEPHLSTQSRASPENIQHQPPAPHESHHLPTSNPMLDSTAGTIPPRMPGPLVTPSPPFSVYHGCSLQQQIGPFDVSHQAYPSLDQLGYNLNPNHELNYMSGVSLIHDCTGMSYEITPEVYEAFSYVRPIATNMTSGSDPGC